MAGITPASPTDHVVKDLVFDFQVLTFLGSRRPTTTAIFQMFTGRKLGLHT